MPISGKEVMELVIRARDNTRGAFTKVGKQVKGLKGNTKGLNKGLGTFRSTLGSLPGPAGRLVGALGPLGLAGAALAAGAAIGFFVASAVKSFSAFEDSMANVRKTTGMTKEETRALGNEIDNMALRLPVAHEELAKIAAIAGQLGIQGSDNILRFTEDIAKMSTAFDMSAEDTATAMAKMANIYDIPLEKISNMGSAINVLGNTTAASESQLMDFGMSLGPTGKQLGFTYEQTMALGASMIEMGVNSSDAGTRLNRAFSMIGQNISEVSKFMGVSTDEFKRSFENMPMETFTQILQKLSEVEGNLEANTIGAQLFGEVGAKSIKAIIGNLDGLQTNLTTVTTGFKENISLEEEFAAKTDTLKAKFALVGNAAESLKINIGAAFAPLVGVLAAGVAKGISGISEAFSAMQKIAGPVLDLLFIQFHALKAFLEGLFAPIMDALKPLRGLLGDTSGAVSRLNAVFKVMSDVFTIITGLSKKLGIILGTLLAKAITPLVAKIKEGIKVLTEFYNKLGPIKNLIEGFKEKVVAGASAVGEWADSFEETTPAVEELKEAVTDFTIEAAKMGPVLTESIKTLESRLTEASGSYKAAIGDITKEITTLKDAWNLASDDQKQAIERQIIALVEVRDELGRGEEEAKKYFDTHTKGAEEATEQQKEFTVKLGKTTITFKGMAAEVVKNADAYKDLEENAEKLLNLDWSVFTTLEKELPNIDAGIGNMSSAFVGLADILSRNVAELDAVKDSIREINEIAAPFLEKGFLKGIEAIGKFAGALSDAGSAINTFAGLQDVSIDGCINFSLHVNDMVTALQLLENQMEDLMPSFANMDSLITNIAEAFVWTPGKKESIAEEINRIANAAKDGSGTIGELWKILEETTKQPTTWFAGQFAMPYIERYKEGVEDIEDITEDFLASGEVLERQMSYTTDALKHQTDQLTKITDALQPYLEFMQTLNDLAALSAISTDDLNRGLAAINDTLEHLSSALSAFDLEPVMKSLFGSGVEGEAEGAAKAFTDTMLKHSGKFITLIAYIERLSFAITTLTGAFTALEDINKSVLADETALIALFGSITEIMENFSNAMDKSGFGEELAKGIEKMVASASPLVDYFKNNNAAVVQFNNSLSMFKSVLGGVMDTLDKLSEISAMIVPEVDEIAAGFDRATEFVNLFDKALMKHIGLGEGFPNYERNLNNIFTGIEAFASNWALITADMEESFKTFDDAISTITGLISDIISLTNAFKDMEDIVIPGVTEMEAALDRIPAAIKAMTEFLGKDTWAAISANIAEFALKWDAINEGISTTTDSFSHFIGIITKIVSACTEMTRIFPNMGEIIVITSDEIAEALKDIPVVMAEVTKYLTTDSFKAIEQGLIDLNTGYTEHAKVLDKVMPSYDSAFDMFAKLAGNVITLSNAFEELKEATIISSIDMDKAMQKIDVFINRFVKALKLNMDDLVASIILVDVEWKKHAKDMEAAMPNYSTATKDIGTLISTVTSLGNALLFLSETGSISEAKFGTGFAALIASIGNFTKAFVKNVDGLVDALKTLRSVWIANEETLVPLMIDFKTISRSFISVAADAYNMSEAFTAFSKSSIGLKLGFERLIDFIKTVTEKTKEFYTPESARAVAQYVTDVGLVIDAFENLATQLEASTRVVTEEVDRTVSAVSTRVSSLQLLTADMYNYGASGIIAFAKGIYDYKWVLEGQMQDIAKMIKAYLGVSSPTELGPLRNIEEWPRNLVKSFASGIKSEMGTLNNSFSGMTLTAPGGSSSGNHTSITFHVTQNIKDKVTADYSTNVLEQMLNRHEIM